MDVTLAPVRVLVAPEAEARLVFAGSALAGVLVRLDDSFGEQAGQWFLEVGFGRAAEHKHPVFPDLDAAREWIARRLDAAQD
jgi:hypothetical protein